MSSLALGLCLAVIASIALNSSYMLQHAGSTGAPDISPRHPVAALRGLLASRLWTLGAILGVSGWGIHIAALAHAPLSIVQAFVAGGLGLMAPFAARILRQGMSAREWIAVATVALALIMLSIGLHDAGPHASADAPVITVFLVGALVGAAALSTVVRSWRAHALGLAGGILYGAADTSIKALTGVASVHGLAAVLISPWLGAAAITTICAFFAFQRGLQTGRAIPVVVLMTGATTVVSIVGGLLVFGDPLGRTPALAYLHVAGFALVTVAGALLAPAAAVPDEARTEFLPVMHREIAAQEQTSYELSS
ncbi:MAG: hypothetical protein NVSMB25_01460 [Thermoleophilaceae bacterium]